MSVDAIIARELGLDPTHVSAVLNLLADGATIPFISRYRKEATGNMNEVNIFKIEQRNQELTELEKRRAYILQIIEAKGKLTDELRTRISGCFDAAELEDIYLPFKEKKRTRAQIARERGLEPLAKIIMSQKRGDLLRTAQRFLSDEVATTEDALKGARDIIAEWVNETEAVRSRVRDQFHRFATVESAMVKGKADEGANYANYFAFSAPLKRVGSHAYLAMRRGEAEGFLRVNIDVDEDRTLGRLYPYFLRSGGSDESQELIMDAIDDAYRRLTRPSIENEMAAEAKAKADDTAINTFATNLRQLLLGAPLGAKRILAIDPGFRTGCKVVCLDANGNLRHHTVIYPTPPANDTEGAGRTIRRLVKDYAIEAISIGNGTASRETERFVKGLGLPEQVQVFVVSENGASVYSASKIARDEFPDEDVTVRGAVSIGRRLADPLAELVKIDPKAIGVGQYQHDVDQTKLKAALDMTVESCVNTVGIDLNTASRELLAYVSGIGPTLAANIVAYRAEKGDFTSRDQLLKVPRLGPKAYEQAAGFLRVPGSKNILDNTAVHPERYALVDRMARDAGLTLEEFVSSPEAFHTVDLKRYQDAATGEETLRDIIAELEKPGRDPREKAVETCFDESITDITDLREGMVLPCIVNNITDFGVFVDLGIHRSGLIHISQLANRRVKHPSEVVKLNQHLMAKVIDIDIRRGRISMSLRDVDKQS